MRKKRWISFVLVVIAILYLSIYGAGETVQKELLSISKRPDGGYSLQIVMNKRYWKLLTAEGVFPSVRQVYVIELIGEGKDWSYRNQPGYYYALSEVKSIQNQWDLGYAWLSADRKYLSINLYWVNSPDDLISSDINGSYDSLGSNK